jgi:predicted O-methyltransferase YrrM
MSLEELVDNSRTDKNTKHSYLPLYQKLLEDKKYTAKNVLEIGIFQGGSIKLWRDFFTNATVWGLDIMNSNDVWDKLKNDDRIILYTEVNAYNIQFFSNTFLDKKTRYDFILDDGPHTLETMKECIQLYSQLLTDDGILIIEDVQSWDWIDALKSQVPDHLKQYVHTYDLRFVKDRYDDIVFTIDKRRKN